MSEPCLVLASPIPNQLAVGIIHSTAPLLNMITVQSVGLSKRQSFHLLISDLLYF